MRSDGGASGRGGSMRGGGWVEDALCALAGRAGPRLTLAASHAIAMRQIERSRHIVTAKKFHLELDRPSDPLGCLDALRDCGGEVSGLGRCMCCAGDALVTGQGWSLVVRGGCGVGVCDAHGSGSLTSLARSHSWCRTALLVRPCRLLLRLRGPGVGRVPPAPGMRAARPPRDGGGRGVRGVWGGCWHAGVGVVELRRGGAYVGGACGGWWRVWCDRRGG